MHIALIADYMPPRIGGIETLFGDLSSTLHEQGHQVTAIHSDLYGASRKSFLRYLLRHGLRQRTLFQSIDHIHTTTFAAALGAFVLAKRYRKPITITIHEIYGSQRDYLKGSWIGWFYQRYEDLLCHLQRDKIITPSQSTKDNILRHYPHLDPQTISIIYNQIDYDFWTRTPQYCGASPQSLLFIGRLGKEKGLTRLLDSLPLVIAEGVPVRLTIIAPKIKRKYPRHIQQQIDETLHTIKKNRLSHHVKWIESFANDNQVKECISQHHIGIVPSLSEGFCYTAVTMESCGLPLIVSDINIFYEVLDQRLDHRYVPRGDCQALADAIIDLHRHHDFAIQKRPEPKFESSLKEYTSLFTSSMKLNSQGRNHR